MHAGVYRERVNPPRGGTSEGQRIVFRAAPGERVEIKGSEPVTGWRRAQNDTWQAQVPASVFGGFNPFADLIRGDWFEPKGRPHHTGAVYLDGEWLTESATLEEALKPAGASPLWFARVEAEATTNPGPIPGTDPNARLAEINVRRTVLIPRRRASTI